MAVAVHPQAAKMMSSILLYTALVWGTAQHTTCNGQKVSAVYMSTALRVACGFRTVLDEVAYAAAVIIPIDILADEKM